MVVMSAHTTSKTDAQTLNEEIVMDKHPIIIREVVVCICVKTFASIIARFWHKGPSRKHPPKVVKNINNNPDLFKMVTKNGRMVMESTRKIKTQKKQAISG